MGTLVDVDDDCAIVSATAPAQTNPYVLARREENQFEQDTAKALELSRADFFDDEYARAPPAKDAQTFRDHGFETAAYLSLREELSKPRRPEDPDDKVIDQLFNDIADGPTYDTVAKFSSEDDRTSDAGEEEEEEEAEEEEKEEEEEEKHVQIGRPQDRSLAD